MEATITRIKEMGYDKYLKYWIIKFRVRCPHCNKINYHAYYQSYEEDLYEARQWGNRQCMQCLENYGIKYDFRMLRN